MGTLPGPETYFHAVVIVAYFAPTVVRRMHGPQGLIENAAHPVVPARPVDRGFCGEFWHTHGRHLTTLAPIPAGPTFSLVAKGWDDTRSTRLIHRHAEITREGRRTLVVPA